MIAVDPLDIVSPRMVSWRKLEEVCSVITDGSHYSPSAVESGGYYMPSVKDMRDDGFDFTTCKQISESDYMSLVRNGCRPEKNDVLIAKDGSMLRYAFAVEGDCNYVVLSSIAILRPDTSLIYPKYLAHYFRQEQFREKVIREQSSKGGVPRIVLKNFKRIKIPIPSLETQKSIVDSLDKLSALTNELIESLSDELLARKKQFEYYRSNLLNFNGGGYRIEVNWIPLKMCCTINKGGYLTKKDSRPGMIPVILGGQQPAYYIDKANHYGDAIVISRSGASAGFVSWWQEPIYVTDGFLIEPGNKLKHKFLYHILKNQQKQLNGMRRGSGVPHITIDMLSNLILPIIPHDVQDRIVALLDSYCSTEEEMEKVLASEIKTRMQQYELICNQLMSFSQNNVA